MLGPVNLTLLGSLFGFGSTSGCSGPWFFTWVLGMYFPDALVSLGVEGVSGWGQMFCKANGERQGMRFNIPLRSSVRGILLNDVEIRQLGSLQSPGSFQKQGLCVSCR